MKNGRTSTSKKIDTSNESSFVLLKQFSYRHEADIAKGLLEMDGIEAIVQADDCGGFDPSINFGTAARIMVKQNDYQRAIKMISGN